MNQWRGNQRHAVTGGTAPHIQTAHTRERRAEQQRQIQKRFGTPLVSITLVTPGEIKDSTIYRQIAVVASVELEWLCQQQQWTILWHETHFRPSGPEILMVVYAAGRKVKAELVKLEERHALGRLWNLDVIDVNGDFISRARLGLPGRRCFICDNRAHECSRSKRHSLSELKESIRRRIEDYEQNQNSNERMHSIVGQPGVE